MSVPKTWGEYARDKTLPETLKLKCGECGRETTMRHDAIVWWAKCNDVLEERGEQPMTTPEVSRCHDCYQVFRAGDIVQTRRQLDELHRAGTMLRKGKVVPQETMERIMAGPFSQSMTLMLQGAGAASKKDRDGKSTDWEVINAD